MGKARAPLCLFGNTWDGCFCGCFARICWLATWSLGEEIVVWNWHVKSAGLRTQTCEDITTNNAASEIADQFNRDPENQTQPWPHSLDKSSMNVGWGGLLFFIFVWHIDLQPMRRKQCFLSREKLKLQNVLQSRDVNARISLNSCGSTFMYHFLFASHLGCHLLRTGPGLWLRMRKNPSAFVVSVAFRATEILTPAGRNPNFSRTRHLELQAHTPVQSACQSLALAYEVFARMKIPKMRLFWQLCSERSLTCSSGT